MVAFHPRIRMRWLTRRTAWAAFCESQTSNQTLAESEPVVLREMRGVHANAKRSASSCCFMASMILHGSIGRGPFIHGTPTIFRADLDWGRETSIFSLSAPVALPIQVFRTARSASLATLLQKAVIAFSLGRSATDSTLRLDLLLTSPRFRVSTVCWEKRSPRLCCA